MKKKKKIKKLSLILSIPGSFITPAVHGASVDSKSGSMLVSVKQVYHAWTEHMYMSEPHTRITVLSILLYIYKYKYRRCAGTRAQYVSL